MYCPTCLRSRFQKTFSEGLAVVITFNYATREESIELVPEDVVFEEWNCVRCRRPLHLKSSQKALDRILERWCVEDDLCIFT